MRGSFCQYKNLLGQPFEGIRSYRVFGMSAIDLLLTIFVAWLVARKTRVETWKMFLIFFGLGTFFHALFCVDTAFVLEMRELLKI
jgi:hypothetical protein